MSISAENTTHESVAAGHTAPEPTPEEAAQLQELYRDFDRENLIPLWTEIADLMPMVPTPKAVPHVWRWSDLYPLAARAGDLVPVGRGGERRAIALANPGLAGTPYATPTLWAAIQYLGARGDRAGTPALAERVPLRRRGRGRLDGRERRPGADVPRRLPADPGLELPRPPQRHR